MKTDEFYATMILRNRQRDGESVRAHLSEEPLHAFTKSFAWLLEVVCPELFLFLRFDPAPVIPDLGAGRAFAVAY